MTTLQWRYGLGLLLIARVFLACTDHRFSTITPGSSPSRLRVKTITQNGPNNAAKISAFTYDAQNRLSQIIDYQLPDSAAKPLEYNSYAYDAQNRLAQLQRQSVPRLGGSTPSNFERYELSYNGSGQVSEVRYFNAYHSSERGDLLFTVPLQYNSAGQLSRSTKTYQTGGLQYSLVNDYTYTGNNLTTINTTETVLRNVAMVTTSTTQLTYDDQVNPFYGSFVIPAPFGDFYFGPLGSRYTYYGGLDNVFTLSPNNVLQSSSATSYQYTYNAANLPTMRTTIVNGATTETLLFAYESY